MPAVKRNRLTRFMWKAHRWIYRVSGGRLGAKVGGHRVLQLTTTGRKSGEPRSVLITFLEDGGRYVLIASNAGHHAHPAWWLNLEANPEASVMVGGDRFVVRAAELHGAERDRLWQRFVTEVDKAYDVYQQRTDRVIPVVALVPQQ